MRQWIALVFLAGPLWAAECPAPTDHSVAFARLVEDIRNAPGQSEATAISDEMWKLWTKAPDQRAQAALDHGMHMRESYDYAGALAEFDWLVEYCPDYAEGYNQRAFIHFLRQDFALALPDLDRALQLNPTHLGALSGRALTLMALGRQDEAQRDLQVAVGLNPWLPERRMLQKNGAAGGKPKDGQSDL